MDLTFTLANSDTFNRDKICCFGCTRFGLVERLTMSGSQSIVSISTVSLSLSYASPGFRNCGDPGQILYSRQTEFVLSPTPHGAILQWNVRSKSQACVLSRKLTLQLKLPRKRRLALFRSSRNIFYLISLVPRCAIDRHQIWLPVGLLLRDNYHSSLSVIFLRLPGLLDLI